MEAAMDLMRRIAPKHSEMALSALLTLLPHHSSDLLSQIDQPLQAVPQKANWQVEKSCDYEVQMRVELHKFCLSREDDNLFKVCFDEESGKEFIQCEYNRDADSYRSPWSNKYHPPLEDGPLPSSQLRELEVEANDTFAIYCDQYYEGGVSSVYMWEDDHLGFVACFLIKKDGSKKAHGRRGNLQEGSWDAVHVIEVRVEDEGTAHYCLTSTVMLSLTTEEKALGSFNLSGSIRRQMMLDLPVEDGHLCNMGKMIEELEGKLRNSLDQVYFGKTKEMVCTLRPPLEGLGFKLPE